METGPEKLTPLMQQYFAIRAEYPNMLLFFQVGDFYELFFEDAKVASAFLAITLTKRGKNKGEDIPLCGVPLHALNHYLVKLIKGGFSVALCDQLTKPQPGTVVERGVTRVYTPGTLTENILLDEKSASYLLSLYPGEKSLGLVFTELLTAQIFATTLPINDQKVLEKLIEAELARFLPDEIVIPNIPQAQGLITGLKKMGYHISLVTPEIGFDEENYERDQEVSPILPTNSLTPDSSVMSSPALQWILQQFSTQTVDKITKNPVINNNLQVLYYYLKKNQTTALEQFKSIQFYDPDEYLILDPATQKNLDIIKNNLDGSRKYTLLSILDRAKTPMGSRTIKKWLLRPLVQKAKIIQRQEVVAGLSKQISTLQKLEIVLEQIPDIERIIGRIALNRAIIQDYLGLYTALELMPELKLLLTSELNFSLIKIIQESIKPFDTLKNLLEASINTDSNVPYMIKPGFDHQLDSLRNLLANGQQEILKLEKKEIERSGINSLKIDYNNISGYYIEITNTHQDKVPADYQHQQTLANRKRFVTPELKALERDLFKAQHELESIENAVFDRVKKEVFTYISPLRQLAQALAHLDGLYSFSIVAYNNNYITPEINDRRDIMITGGRHPVIEQTLRDPFVPNDTSLINETSLWLVTGPNMGGKSTYLRQVALICIMAQCGSLVPATSASLPILDRVFTRIGAGDNLAEGKSTFLVEMEETATICTQATKNSLVILDEVGRGTSTFDGIALAQAIVEYLYLTVKARCLFATHYHELTRLTHTHTGIANYHMVCRKTASGILFLHTIAPGQTEGSFGVEVAKLAQLPDYIVKRANILLKSMEMTADQGSQTSLMSIMSIIPAQRAQNDDKTVPNDEKSSVLREQVIRLEHQIVQYKNCLEKLAKAPLDDISPRQALDLVWHMWEQYKNIS